MSGHRILVGVSGGVAAYKTAQLVSRLVQDGVEVRVIMTASAEQFIGRATFAALTGHPVAVDSFDSDAHPLGAHIELTTPADLLCIAPATANFLAKAAQGLADDLLSTAYLAFEGPVLMAPAMNQQMWKHPAVQRNMARLQEDGVQMLGPEEGWLSCRQEGRGRMLAPDDIFEAIRRRLASTP